MLLSDVAKPVPAGKRPPEDTRWRPSLGTAHHRKSRRAAQMSGDLINRRGQATQRGEKEQCVGTCDRGLEEGAAHRRCGTAPLRSLVRAVAAQ